MESRDLKKLKKIKKVCLFVPSFSGGGAEKVMVTVANYLTTLGIKIDFVIFKNQGPFRELINEKVNIIDLKASRVLFGIFKLARYLNQTKPQICLSAMRHSNIAILAAKYLSFSTMPIIISEHNDPSILRKRKNGIFLRSFMNLLYPFADQIVAVSKGVAEQLHDMLAIEPMKISVIYNPVITSEIYLKSEEDIDLSYFAGKKLIIAAGRLTDQKDYSTLLKAFSIVRDKIKNCNLIILGEGDQQSQLIELARKLGIESHTFFKGFVDNPFKWMKNADIFVLSSKFEGLGNVIIEALACSTQVISTDCPSGPKEILKDGEYGDLVPVGA